MNHNKIFTEKEGFWTGHLSAQKVSGLSQGQYCLQQGIGYRAFLYHRYKAEGKLKAKKSTLRFIETKPKLLGHNQSETLQLMLANGVKMGIPEQINTTFLKAVMTIAAAL